MATLLVNTPAGMDPVGGINWVQAWSLQNCRDMTPAMDLDVETGREQPEKEQRQDI